MKKILNTISLICSVMLILLILSSCKKTINCAAANEQFFKIQNFSEQESTRIIFRKYVKNTNFTQRVDTILLIKDVNADYTVVRDLVTNTIDYIIIDPARVAGFGITSAFDYELFFPVANISRRITEVTEVQKQYQYDVFSLQRRSCVNEISSAKLDGVLFSRIPVITK